MLLLVRTVNKAVVFTDKFNIFKNRELGTDCKGVDTCIMFNNLLSPDQHLFLWNTVYASGCISHWGSANEHLSKGTQNSTTVKLSLEYQLLRQVRS